MDREDHSINDTPFGKTIPRIPPVAGAHPSDDGKIRLFRPSDTGGLRSITYLHAMAELAVEGLVLVEPATTFVSLGCFDDPRTVDLAFCRTAGIPVMRRALGGGTVLLGPGQVFYQLVLKRDHPLVRGVVNDVFRRLSQAPMDAYRRLGVDVRYRPLTDLVTQEERKISGQGAGEINGHFCYAGAVLRDFDTDLMHRVLCAGSPHHRGRILQALNDNMTWLARELGHPVASDLVFEALYTSFTQLLGVMSEAPLPDPVVARARSLETELTSDDALSIDDPKPRHVLKIREGVGIRHARRAINGLEIEVHVDIEDDRIAVIEITGLPGGQAVAHALRGRTFALAAVTEALATTILPASVAVTELAQLIIGVN
ncbi:MAG: lipoyl protein ligase domain-containing protein [Acidiferrobacteraceae bacterium]